MQAGVRVITYLACIRSSVTGHSCEGIGAFYTYSGKDQQLYVNSHRITFN